MSQALRSIVNLCPNLSDLVCVASFEDPYDCLKALDSDKTILPNINKIDLVKLYDHSGSIRACHLEVNLRFCETISSLYISPPSTLEQEYGGIVEFLSRFKKLKYLKVAPKSESDKCAGNRSVNLSSLIQDHKELEVLKLYSFGRITIGNTPSAAASTTTTDGSTGLNGLKNLKIMSHQAEFNLLQFIMDKFRNLEKLRLLICAQLSSPNKPISNYEYQMIIKRFQDYHKQIKRVNISFNDYEDDHYFVNRQGDQEWPEYNYNGKEDEYDFWMDGEDDMSMDHDIENQSWHEEWLIEQEEKEARRAWFQKHINELLSEAEEEVDSEAQDDGSLSQEQSSDEEEDSGEEEVTSSQQYHQTGLVSNAGNDQHEEKDKDDLYQSEYEEGDYSGGSESDNDTEEVVCRPM